jgi:hypothetical protein
LADDDDDAVTGIFLFSHHEAWRGGKNWVEGI